MSGIGEIETLKQKLERWADGQIGDPEDHDGRDELFWPGNKSAQITYVLSAGAIIIAGAAVVSHQPDVTKNVPLLLKESAGILLLAGLAWPVASYFLTVAHYDADHYTHSTDHTHLITVGMKFVLMTGARALLGVNNLVNRK